MAAIIDKNAVYSCDEMMEICGLTRRQLYALSNRRKAPPAIEITQKNRRYIGKDIIEWLESQKQPQIR